MSHIVQKDTKKATQYLKNSVNLFEKFKDFNIDIP